MQSSNAKKHTTKNPVRKYFIENFLSSLNKDILGLKPTTILNLAYNFFSLGDDFEHLDNCAFLPFKRLESKDFKVINYSYLSLDRC